MKVLVIEADYSLRLALHRFLERAGYAVDVVTGYATARGQLAGHRHDFVLLAPELPDGDGWELLRAATRHGEHPAAFIVLTAANSVEARLRGFANGADDCLSKPLSLSELERRMRAIARQQGGPSRPEVPFGDGFVLSAAARTVRHGGQDVPLSRAQFDLLYHLLRHQGKAFTRAQLGAHLGRGPAGSNFIDVHVMNLRKALARHASADFLETVNGVGYRMAGLPGDEPAVPTNWKKHRKPGP